MDSKIADPSLLLFLSKPGSWCRNCDMHTNKGSHILERNFQKGVSSRLIPDSVKAGEEPNLSMAITRAPRINMK